MSLRERLPSVFPLFDDDSRLKVIVDALDDELTELEDDTEDVQDSLFVETADGQSLDLIGDDFGQIGQRRGRNDQAYRQFLQSIVPAFDGRGTERDVEVAVAAGIASSPDDVDLIQDFDNQEYEVVLKNAAWTAHQSGTVRELADLADPVGVDRVDPVHNELPTASVGIGSGSTVINSGTELETAIVGIDAGDTTHETINSEDTLGVGTLDGDGTLS